MIRIQLRIVKENTNLMIGIEILASKNVKTFSPINSVCPYITYTGKGSFATYSHIHDKAHDYSTT